MPLTTCKDCKKMISTNAENCPNCGSPLKHKSLVTKDIGLGGFIYFMLIVWGTYLIFSGNLVGFLLILIGAILLFVRLKIWSGIGKK